MATSVKVKLRDKPNNEDLHGIYIQVIHNRRNTKFSVNHYVRKKHFKGTDLSWIKGHPRSDKINHDIQSLKSDIEDTIFELKRARDHFELKDIKKAVTGEQEADLSTITFSKYLKDYHALNPDHLGPNTLTYYKSTLTRWDEILSHVKLSEIDEEVIVKFRSYLLEDCENSVNTAYNRLKTVRKMLHMARRKGLIGSNPFANIRLKQEKGQRGYLTWKELKKLEDEEVSSDSLQNCCPVDWHGNPAEIPNNGKLNL